MYKIRVANSEFFNKPLSSLYLKGQWQRKKFMNHTKAVLFCFSLAEQTIA
jgi:hypothetical protein